jgi:hypothetical protein
MKKDTIKTGDMVAMTAGLKEKLLPHSKEHLEEFGHCVGVVEDLVDYGKGNFGPEFNVRWYPSKLRYAYDPEDLYIVKDVTKQALKAMSKRFREEDGLK